MVERLERRHQRRTAGIGHQPAATLFVAALIMNAAEAILVDRGAKDHQSRNDIDLAPTGTEIESALAPNDHGWQPDLVLAPGSQREPLLCIPWKHNEAGIWLMTKPYARHWSKVQ